MTREQLIDQAVRQIIRERPWLSSESIHGLILQQWPHTVQMWWKEHADYGLANRIVRGDDASSMRAP